MSTKKPPIGVPPKTTHDFLRATDLMLAIKRYLDEGQWPPEEWATELAELNSANAPPKFEIKAGAIHHV